MFLRDGHDDLVLTICTVRYNDLYNTRTILHKSISILTHTTLRTFKVISMENKRPSNHSLPYNLASVLVMPTRPTRTREYPGVTKSMPSTLNILYSLTAIRTNRLYPERHATTYAFGVRKKGGPFELRPRFEDDMRGLSRTARAKEVLKKKKGAARECRSAIRREMHLRRQVSRRGWWSRSSMEDVGGGTL